MSVCLRRCGAWCGTAAPVVYLCIYFRGKDEVCVSAFWPYPACGWPFCRLLFWAVLASVPALALLCRHECLQEVFCHGNTTSRVVPRECYPTDGTEDKEDAQSGTVLGSSGLQVKFAATSKCQVREA